MTLTKNTRARNILHRPGERGERGKISADSKKRMYRVVLVFTCLITCSNCSLVRFTVLTEVSPAVVPVGDAAVITCRTSIVLQLLEVRWIRIQGGNYSIINIFRDGKDQQRCDLPEYVGRTEVMAEGLAQGRVALRLFNVSVADEGTHRCFLKGVYYFDMSDLELRVSALGSVPRIDIEGFQDGALKAVCRSAGWYPKPALVNKEDDGEMEIRQEENGLYNIEYPRIITENSNRTFSCRLRTMFPDQQRESLIYVADGAFRKSVNLTVIIVLAAIAAVLVAAGLVALYLRTCQINRRGNKQRNNPGAPSVVYSVPNYLKVPPEEGLSNGHTDPVCRVCG